MGKKTDRMAIAFLTIFLLALLMRFYVLDERVMHHDEGVFAISFVKPIYDSGEYIYNPKSTYHGPFLYYTEALGFRLFGVNEFGLRFFSALFGSLLIPLLFLLRKYTGNLAAVTSSLFIAVSPSIVYYSRFASSHETFLVFFELAAITFFFLFWNNRDKKYLYDGFGSLALMLTTKEASYAIIFLLMLFVVGTIIFTKTKKKYDTKENIRKTVLFLSRIKKDIVISILIAFTIYATFYTSFFRYPDNLIHTIAEAIPSMLSTSQESIGHHKPFFYYTEILIQYELPMLIFTLIGLLYFSKNLFTKFWSYLFVSTWFLFSIVAYKTPWNILHIMLPMVMVAGIGAQELYKKFGRIMIPIFVVALLYTAWISYGTNYIDHSGQFNQLAYVTTTPELIDMVNRIYAFNKSAEIKVLSPEQWPLAWYLRDYKRVGYYGYIINESDADVVIVKREDKEKLQDNLTGTYESEDYQLRYGVWLSAFFRQNVSST